MYAQTWKTYGHGRMVAWVYGFGFIHDVNSNARVQWVMTSLVQGNIYSLDKFTHNYVKSTLQFQRKKICKDYKDATIMDGMETKYHVISNLILGVVFMCCKIGGFARFSYSDWGLMLCIKCCNHLNLGNDTNCFMIECVNPTQILWLILSGCILILHVCLCFSTKIEIICMC